MTPRTLIPEPVLRNAVNASCTCGGRGPADDPGVCPACVVWHRVQAAIRDGYDHRTDPRPMTDRWAAMGFHVEWTDVNRAYVVCPSVALERDERCKTAICRTVDEVEAYVTAHARGEVGT